MLPHSQGPAVSPAWYPSPAAPAAGVTPQPAAVAQQPVVSQTRRPRSGILASLVDGGAIVGGAARLWWRHWPVLFAICLFGIAAKHWLLELGVWLSRKNATLGLLAFVTGPLVLLACFVLMMMVAGRSAPGRPQEQISIKNLLRQVTSLIIPFTAIYAALGLLRSDFADYYFQVWYSDPTNPNMLSRLPANTMTSLIVALVAVVLLRWLAPRWLHSRAWLIVALISAYLELLWAAGMAHWLSLDGLLLGNRRVAVWLSSGGTRAADALGPVHGVAVWVGQQLSDADIGLLTPVAWLLLGLVISRGGAELEDGPRGDTRPRWLTALPGPIRWAAGGVRTDLQTRFSPLYRGVETMLRGGLIPMVVLCVAVAAWMASSRWLWEIERVVVGPRDLGTRWAPLFYWLTPLNDAVAIVGATCLVAAAVERIRKRGIRLMPAADDERVTAQV